MTAELKNKLIGRNSGGYLETIAYFNDVIKTNLQIFWNDMISKKDK